MRIKSVPEDFVVEEITDIPIGKGVLFVYKATKKSMNTREMVLSLAKQNGVHERSIRVAGLKDRHAITTQYLTSEKQLSSTDNNISIKLVGQTPEHIHLGALKGNAFQIRVLDAPPAINAQPINYFGDQRFSSSNVELGLHILRGEWKVLAEKLKDEFDGVRKQLEKDPNSHIHAVQKAPHQILLIYIHSVQSWLFNEAVSAYVKDVCNDVVEVPYAHGMLAFPKSPIDNINAPLVGAVQEYGQFKKYYEELFVKHNVAPHQFMIRSIPNLTQEGTTRNILPELSNLQVKQEGDVAVVTMTLGSGSYATVCLEAIFGERV